MTNLMKNICIIFIGFAVALLTYSQIKKQNLTLGQSEKVESKAQQVKKLIVKYKKPSRVEIENFTQKYKDDLKEIRSLKIPLDATSNFYMQVQLFSDDSDAKAPLIVQIKFKDLKTEALIKEDSLNLD